MEDKMLTLLCSVILSATLTPAPLLPGSPDFGLPDTFVLKSEWDRRCYYADWFEYNGQRYNTPGGATVYVQGYVGERVMITPELNVFVITAIILFRKMKGSKK
jgi:hypothetical protein